MAISDSEKSVNTAAYWLARADSVRAVAKVTKDPRLRTHLIAAAEGYESIAQYLAGPTGGSPESIKAVAG
jgi:hypothetical protein